MDGCITEFGADPNGVQFSTQAIQKAIDAAATDGGGCVVVPPGSYRIATLFLRSRAHLRFEPGSELIGAAELAAYHRVDGFPVGLLYARDAEDITISGPGRVDGSSPAFMGPAPADEPDAPYHPLERPGQMLLFSECRRVRLRDVTLSGAPFWTTNFADCADVKVHAVTVDNDMRVPNNDGLNFTCCQDVIVSDCTVRAGDDAIAVTGLKRHPGITGPTGALGGTRNVVVANCILRSRSAGIRIGAGELDVADCRYSNLIITDTNRGIVVWQRDGSSIERIAFAHLTIRTRAPRARGWWGKSDPNNNGNWSQPANWADGVPGIDNTIALLHSVNGNGSSGTNVRTITLDTSVTLDELQMRQDADNFQERPVARSRPGH